MKIQPENIDDIVAILATEFRCFGGGRTSQFNPITNALADSPASFATGVDVKDVVTRALELAKEIEN